MKPHVPQFRLSLCRLAQISLAGRLRGHAQGLRWRTLQAARAQHAHLAARANHPAGPAIFGIDAQIATHRFAAGIGTRTIGRRAGARAMPLLARLALAAAHATSAAVGDVSLYVRADRLAVDPGTGGARGGTGGRVPSNAPTVAGRDHQEQKQGKHPPQKVGGPQAG